MSLSPLAFSGISSFSESFQKILERSQRVSEIPLTRLQNDKIDLLQRKSLAAAFEGVAGAFTASLRNLGTVGDRVGVAATSSDTSKVKINSSTATSPATYTITDITSLATPAAETSATGYADTSSAPVSATGELRLTFGSTIYNISLTPEQNNLTGLRDAINALEAGVTATVFTTGTGGLPNFLSLTAASSGATTLSLVDDPDGAATALLTSANQGSNAEFKLNGVPVSKASNVINDVVSGVSFTIAGLTSGSGVTLTLASDRNQLSTALQSLAGAYNDVVDFVDSQIGRAAGLLSGSNLISNASDALRRFTAFSGTGTVKSLSDVGLVLDSSGKLSFDAALFGELSDAQLGSAFQFAGTSSSGLASLTSRFAAISDSVTGSARLEQDQYDLTEARLSKQIEELTDRVTAQQESLRQRLQVADSLLASLESQRQLVEAQLEGLNLTLYGKNS